MRTELNLEEEEMCLFQNIFFYAATFKFVPILRAKLFSDSFFISFSATFEISNFPSLVSHQEEKQLRFRDNLKVLSYIEA